MMKDLHHERKDTLESNREAPRDLTVSEEKAETDPIRNHDTLLPYQHRLPGLKSQMWDVRR